MNVDFLTFSTGLSENYVRFLRFVPASLQKINMDHKRHFLQDPMLIRGICPARVPRELIMNLLRIFSWTL